ncbi:MAG: carboxypeptidase-like regulatory domain-containing protein, partial [Candidatus Acidiferrales bacterium]
MKRGLAICSVAAWISILFWGGTPAWSQSLTSLQGTVTDPSGAAVVNAIVHLINSANNSDHTAITDNRGRYSFSKVAPGTYHLLIEVQGFESFEQTDIHLLANSPATLDVKLTIAQVQQSVTVRPQGSEQCLAPLARIFPDVGAGLRTIRRGPSGNYYVLTAPGAAAMIYSSDGKQ